MNKLMRLFFALIKKILGVKTPSPLLDSYNKPYYYEFDYLKDQMKDVNKWKN